MRVAFKLLIGSLLTLSALSNSVNAQVVISQVYGAGGNTGATYNRDFVELFNRGSTPVSLNGLTVQYSSATGTGNFAVGATLPNVTLGAGQYHLVGMSSGANGAALPTVDTSGTSAMATAAGKVVLANSSTALACNGGSTPCSAAQLALIVDLVGYGTANFFEGVAPTPTPSATLSVARAGNGCTDTNQNGADFTAVTPAARNTTSSLQNCGGTSLPLLNISDASTAEGDSGSKVFTFGVNLNQPAGAGGVTINYSTADGTATAGTDYVASSGSATIPEGATSATVSVTINGDTTAEPSETFFVNIDSVTGAVIADAQGLGTIANDDIVITQIHAIQGSGDASPLAGTNGVSTRGIVTGIRNTGFFMQTADAEADADPSTSQGVFVFTSTAPTVARGDLVIVTGNIVEFFQLTEITTPVVTVLSSGNPMPTAIVLTTADGALPSPERYESMRITPNLTVVAPAGGNESEANATSTSNGNFHGVLPGVARPFREPGVSVLDTFVPPAGVTRFDGNLELIVVQSRGLGGAAMNPNAGDVLTGISGILDFGFGFYKFYPDSGQTFTSSVTPTAVSDKTADEFTVAGFNLFRFFDTVNDPNDDPVLTPTALNNRLAKTADAICGYLKTPDIIGVVEVENIGVLTQLANTINSGQVAGGAAVASCNTAPNYEAILIEGNDIGGIDVGFLVSKKIVGSGSTARVEVLEVVQENKDEVLTNPDGSTGLLNDRPTLRIQVVIHNANGASYPVTVMINHLRSLSSVTDATDGPRVRNKRLKQAESLAKLIQARQVANPNEKIILLGDFNAFEFSDGLVDSMGIITGKEVPANEVTLHSGYVVTTPLTNMTTVDLPNQRYSFSFDGNAQSLDHAVVNEALLMQDGVRSEHARINSDFAIINYGVYGGLPTRVSDHDPVVLYIKPRAFVDLDLGVGVTNPDTNLAVGGNTTFTVNASNLDTTRNASNAVLTLLLDAAINGVTVTPPATASCAAPVLTTSTTSISCTIASFTAASNTSFSVLVPLPATLGTAPLTLSASIAADQGDSITSNNIASDSVSVIGQSANLAIRMRGPTRLYVGTKTRINAVVDNYGVDAATGVSVALTTNAPNSAIAMTAPSGWSCNLDSTYATARFLCSINGNAPLAVGQRPNFTLRFSAPASMSGTGLIIGAGISALAADPVMANNSDSYSLQIETLRGIPTPPAPPKD